MWTRNVLLAALAAAAAVMMSAGVAAADMKGAAYADLRFGLDHFEQTGPAALATQTDLANHGSVWGLKGSATQDGVTAFGGLERWLDTDQRNAGVDLARQSYAGLMTQYGTVQFGTFATAYMNAGRKLDPFYGTGAAGVGNPGVSTTGASGPSHGQSLLTADVAGSGFVANQLAYTTASLCGLTANAAVMFDESSVPGTSRQADYAAGLEWDDAGLAAGMQYLDANAAATNTSLVRKESALRLHGGFSRDRFGVNVSAERIDHTGGTRDADYLQANAWFGVLPGTRIAASYGLENETLAEGSSVRVGVFHDVFDNFTLNVVYRNYNGKPEAGGAIDHSDDQVISLGANYRFEIGASSAAR